ncbi:MAG TPA: amidophosphoribosyltransferase [Clostridiales bacterium]|nr:amidophosphoribosyltransferase [Clostridiales bacterium]
MRIETACQAAREDRIREECAIFGISTRLEEAAGITYNALLSLQHRGQEGAGIAVLAGSSIHCHKNLGLVSEVFSGEILAGFPAGRIAVGHTRYSTTGTNAIRNVQPFVTEYLTGRIATAHNGNITNARLLKQELQKNGLDFHASSDSEVVSSLIAYHSLKSDDLLEGVVQAARELEGAYSLVVMGSGNQLIAVRDPRGFRPLCLGENEAGMGVASESCALDSCGFSFVRDVRPGEAVVIEDGRIVKSIDFAASANPGICIFEYVYFARPDSVIDGLSVYEARFNMGRTLAMEHPVKADAVCGVPDSGIEAALGYASESGLPLVPGFVKNRYIGRSFIFPSQSQRESAVQLKLNPLKVNVDGKRIVLVDDSIVRGTTSEKIVRSLKKAGAREVHMRISSPPFRYSCHFGTDIDDEKNLIANHMSIEAVQRKIGADSLGYISVQGLKAACSRCALPFCTRCFTGYPAGESRYGRKTQLEEES